jgi:D-alanyl-D-alanine carboxypeptidase/D-alanyl-D-alanine-endopeptidase (penicillin-binding protein 4)
MDPSERRRQTAAAARLGFLAIGVVAAFLFVLQLWRGDEGTGSVVASEPERRPSPMHVLEPGTRDTRPPELTAKTEESTRVLPATEEATPLDAAESASPARHVRVTPARDAALTGRIQAHISAALADAQKRSKGKVTSSNTTIAVHVVRPAAHTELVSLSSDASLMPASNMKLLTSASALVLLGESWQFETAFERGGPIEGSTLRGDLIVRAGGDPLYDREGDGEVAHLLAPVVEVLRGAGITRIEGDVVLDEGSYADPEPGPGWPDAAQYWQEHCARAGGFSANAGCLTANVRPGSVGGTAPSRVLPAAHGLKRVGTVKTAKAGSRLDVAVGAVPGRVTLRGSFPAGLDSWTDRFAAPDPVELFASVLRDALERGGIRITGEVRRERGAPSGTPMVLLRTPLASALYPINLDSNNAVADQLFLAMGAARGLGGTRAGGEQAVKSALELLGVPHEGLVQVGGSGLSRESRLTARQLTALLSATTELSPSAFALFYDTLPTSGISGSLESRMKQPPVRGRVHAKTGWIEGASALSGFVESESGEQLVFSILVGYPRASGLNKYCWKPMQDEICEELVGWHE